MAISFIKSSTIGRSVPGVSKTRTDAQSVGATVNYSVISDRFHYEDSGVFMEFEIVGANVRFSPAVDAAFRPFVPVPPGLNPATRVPFNSTLAPGTPHSVSYDTTRLGVWSAPPEFEMIAASSDRVFAKEKGKDNFFLALPTQLYLHQNAGLPILPGSFFKLDPELGTAGARLADLLFHLTTGDDKSHLLTERFPVYAAIYTVMSPLSVLVPMARKLFQSMCVQVHPFVWIKMDLRPPRDGRGVPTTDYPAYDHVIYDRLLPPDEVKNSIDYDYVLDLAVGLSNYHEQYEPIYGGEIDVMEEPCPVPGWTFDELYRLVAGPIQDVGGFIDGTTIYYLLVRLRGGGPAGTLETENELGRRNDDFKKSYTILYSDEQQAFMERWRAISLDDTQYSNPAIMPIAAYSKAATTNFEPLKFMDPFKAGFIRSFSRMAVARQVIIVNGFDNQDGVLGEGKHRLYSLHLGWPTMDRTWRVRDFPVEASVDSSAGEVVDPRSINIREDMTIYVNGSKKVDWETSAIQGVWVQKYLPADNQEVPSAAEVAAGSTDVALTNPYTHPWQFYESSVFQKMHRNFSHFGVYEKVNSRCQFYDIIIQGNDIPAVEGLVWVDEKHQLTIKRNELNWFKAAIAVAGIGTTWPATLVVALTSILVAVLASIAAPISIAAWIALMSTVLTFLVALAVTICDRKTLPSLYEDKLRFFIKHTDRGHIMMYHDKREDKNVSFDDLEKKDVELVDSSLPSRKITVTVVRQVRTPRRIGARGVVSPPEVKRADVILELDSDGSPTKVKLEFTSARTVANFANTTAFFNWLQINVARAKIGMIDTVTGAPTILFDSDDVAMNVTDGVFTCEWEVKSPLLRFSPSPLSRLLSKQGQITRGVSVWFVGITGMVNTAEQLRFKTSTSKI